MTIHKSITYFNNKAKIDKAYHQRTAHKIQLYNNNLVDKFVTDFNDAGVSSKPPKSMVMAELAILNQPEVYKNYNRIINSKYTSNDNLNNMLIKNKAQKDLDNVVKGELDRISKNLDYVEQVMKKYEVPTKAYNELLNKQKAKSVANRQQILKEVAIKSNDLLVSEGLNIPSNVFSYRDLETTAQSLLRQSQMTAGYEEKQAINENYLNEGKNEIYTHKQWIHTHGGKTTRHMSNHMQKVRFDEPFIVVNDNTLDIDEMMYPCDPAGSYSNAWICYCEVDYLIGEDDPYSQTLDYLNGSIDIANPNLFSDAPKVTFMPNIKGLFEESKPIGEPININQSTIGNEISTIGEGRYVVEPEALQITPEGNYEFKGIEIKQFDEYGSAVLTKEQIKNHNDQFFERYNDKPSAVKIGENTLEKNVIEEFNRFADETRHNDYESVMFCDKNGNVILEKTDFKESTVSWSNKLLNEYMEENHILGDLDHTHNHPTRPTDSPIYEFPTMFSLADVSHMFDITKLKINGEEVTVTPHKSVSVEYCNGMRMTLERIEGNGLSNPVLDDFMDSGYTIAEYRLNRDNVKNFTGMTELKMEFNEAYNELTAAYFDFLKKGERKVEEHIMDYMDEKIESGAYNPETATGEQFRAFQEELKREEQRFAKELARDENNSFNQEVKFQKEMFKELGFNLSLEWLY